MADSHPKELQPTKPTSGRPLVVVLKRTWFDAIILGTKRHEWRRHNNRFNSITCRIGRTVKLVAGYRKDRPTAYATIAGIDFKLTEPGSLYGPGVECIVIELRDVRSAA